VKTIENASAKKLFILFALIQTIFTIFSGIHADEAYYWDWTRFLSLGYFDHPPMVAWIIRLFQIPFGDGPQAIKVACAALNIGTVGALALLIRNFSKSNSALIILFAIFFGSPVFGILSKFMTPDIPLFFFWACSLLLGYMIIDSKEQKLRFWVLLGVTTGLGMYSKYTFVLFFPVFAFSLIFSRRDLLKTVYPYMTMIIAIIIGIPHLIWNVTNDWPSISFQMNHGLGSDSYSLGYLGEYLSAEFALFNPFISIALVVALFAIIRYHRKNPTQVFMAIATIFPLLFFAYSNLKKRGNANWPAMAFLSGAVIIVWFYENSAGPKMKKYLRGSLIFGVIATGIISIQIVKPIIPLQSVVNEIHGWDALATQMDSLISEVQIENPRFAVNSFQMAGTMGLYLDDHPRVYALNIGSRTNHYRFLEERNSFGEGEFLYIGETVRQNRNENSEDMEPDYYYELHGHIQDAFSTIEQVGEADLVQGKKVKKYGLFRVTLKSTEYLN